MQEPETKYEKSAPQEVLIVHGAALAGVALRLAQREQRIQQFVVPDGVTKATISPGTILYDEGTMYPDHLKDHIISEEDIARFNAAIDGVPPRRLSIELNHSDYHPSFVRVGVRLNGVERNDIKFYDVNTMHAITVTGVHLTGIVEPYWRFPETRQQRRARERWERKHK